MSHKGDGEFCGTFGFHPSPLASGPILADHHTPIAIRDPAELCVRRPVPVRQLRRVHRVMTCITQQPRHARRELRVDEEPHAAPSGVIRLRAASAPNSNAANRSSRSRSG